jgi:hypothetical protein
MERASNNSSTSVTQSTDRMVEGSFLNALSQEREISNVTERWSRFRYQGRNEPKGSPDALRRAKLALGPLTLEHNPHLKVLCPCENCIDRNIRNVAAEFNARRLVIEGAPRKKTVADNMRRVRDGARFFAETLVALDDYSRDLLLIPYKLLEYDAPILRLYKAAQGMDLPKPETAETAAADGPLVERLRALEEYVDRCLEDFTGWDEEETVSFDRGGNTNLMKERFGPPAWHIVKNCWYFFENCRPGEATASETGPFLQFVNCVYEYATGEIEENSTLLNWIKKLARLLRHHDNLLQKLGPLEVELDELKLDPQTPERDAHIARLEAQLPALREEVVNALVATNHRNFGPKS